MVKVIFIGGTYRAVMTFEYLLAKKNVQIVYAIFMKGYENEHIYAMKLGALAEDSKINHTVSDKITDQILETVKQLNADVIVGGGIWRSIVPLSFANAAKFGYIGLHGTALPEYRGMAGINWQIMNGSDKIRMRMLRLAEGIDDGDLIANEKREILEYSVDLQNNLHLQEIFNEYNKEHLRATGDLIELIETERITFIKQNNTLATYSCHFGPEDAQIDWNKSTLEIFNLIRSQSKPYCGSYTYFKGKKITIWRAEPLYNYLNYKGRINGKVVERNLEEKFVVILTDDGAIKITEAECGRSFSVIDLFSTIRDRCKTKVEAMTDYIASKFSDEFVI
jgi:methionyl-tRNA formyltransferase